MGLLARVRRLGEEKNLLSLPRIEPRIFNRLTRKEATNSTDLLMAGNGMFICRRLLGKKQI